MWSCPLSTFRRTRTTRARAGPRPGIRPRNRRPVAGHKNKFDCGNHRTGQPRCAQLMAKTWNAFASTCRTQQGTFAVSRRRSVERVPVDGEPRFAGGELVMAPRLIHDSYARVRSGSLERGGTSRSGPPGPLPRQVEQRSDPDRSPRLEVSRAKSLRASAIGLLTRIGLARSFRPLRGEPRHHVRDVFVRTSRARVRCSANRARPARTPHDDDCSQALIAHQRQVGPGRWSRASASRRRPV